MLKFLNLLVMVGIAMLPNVAQCEIKTLNQFSQIQEIFKRTNGETLGVFDIDMVLIRPDAGDLAFQMPNMKKHKDAIKQPLSSLTPLEKDLMLNLIMKTGSPLLVEEKAPFYISEIQKKTPKLIALTASLTGKLEDVSDVILHRYEILKKFGIDFSNSFPEQQPRVFANFQSYRNNYPEFKQGILSANGEGNKVSKGVILIEFLKKAAYQPEEVVFVDDREKNVQDVASALAQYDPKIKFTGVVYTGAETIPTPEMDENAFKQAWVEKIERAKELAK